MSYIYDPNQTGQTQGNQPPQDQSTPPTPTTAGGGGVAPVGGATAGVQNKPTSSGSFTNIQNYLSANQGSGLGGQLAGKVQGDVNKTNQDITQSSQNFDTASQAGRNQYDPNLVNQATTDTTNFASQDPNVAAFQKQLNSSYGGPQNLQNYSQLQSEVGNNQNLANLSQTQSGRMSLLNNYFNNGQYSQGQQNLDNLILQGSPQEAQQLSQVTQYGNQAANNLAQAQAAAQAQAGQYGTEAANTNAQTQVALGGANTSFQTGLNQNLANAQNTQNQDWSQFQQGLPTETFSAPVYQALQSGLGINPDTALYNTNLSNWVSQGNTPTLANTASADDYAKAAALAKLGGTTNTILTDPTQAGQWQANGPFTFDKTGFGQQLAQNNQIYNTDPTRIADVNAVSNAQNLQNLGGAYTNWINSGLGYLGQQNPVQGGVPVGEKGNEVSLPNQQAAQFLNGVENWNNVNWGGGPADAALSALPGSQFGQGFQQATQSAYQQLSNLIGGNAPFSVENLLKMNTGQGTAGQQAQAANQYINSPVSQNYNGTTTPVTDFNTPQNLQNILGQGNTFTTDINQIAQQNLVNQQNALQAQQAKLGAFQKLKEAVS